MYICIEIQLCRSDKYHIIMKEVIKVPKSMLIQ